MTSAVQAFSHCWPKNKETYKWLQKTVENKNLFDPFVHQTALQELAKGWHDDPDTLTLLKAYAKDDQDAGVRGTALHELAQVWQDDPELASLMEQIKIIERS
jgi:hypothetical protein